MIYMKKELRNLALGGITSLVLIGCFGDGPNYKHLTREELMKKI